MIPIISIKLELYDLLCDSETPYQKFKKIADKLVPDITIVTNIEFQTKRKFYDRLTLPIVTEDTSFKANVYNLFLQVPSIISFLTSDTIRFVKYKGAFSVVPRSKRPYADWWVRLRSSKQLELQSDWFIDYCRKYQFNLDVERMKNTSVSKLASMSSYFGNNNKNPLSNDIHDFLSILNDNDVKKYYLKRDSRIKELSKRGVY